MNQVEIPDIPLITAIVLVTGAALFVIGRYTFTSYRGDRLEPHQTTPPESRS